MGSAELCPRSPDPNRNELHDEILNLHKLADRGELEALAVALGQLTPEARALLNSRGENLARSFETRRSAGSRV